MIKDLSVVICSLGCGPGVQLSDRTQMSWIKHRGALRRVPMLGGEVQGMTCQTPYHDPQEELWHVSLQIRTNVSCA